MCDQHQNIDPRDYMPEKGLIGVENLGNEQRKVIKRIEFLIEHIIGPYAPTMKYGIWYGMFMHLAHSTPITKAFFREVVNM